ncbi:MAG: GFA family protein [Kofleriaceae bacterium]
MTDWKLPWTGHCRCERLAFRITEAPIMTMACHCTGCQRMTASAYSLSVMVPASGFELTAGSTEIGGLHGGTRHFHCEFCKSWVFTRPDGVDGFVNVRSSMLDERTWFQPFVETSTAEGYAWAKTGAKHSFPNIPAQGTWGPVMADFNANGPKP